MFKWKLKTPVTVSNAIYLEDKQGNEVHPFKSRFLQMGLVKYDFGVCLLKKEAIDKFINTFINCPVIIDHKDYITKNDIVGTVKNIWFSPEDGWFWCDGIITDDKAIELIKNGYNVSCQYAITEYIDNTEGELHNGNPYDKEILNGVFEHLAIVENPRYEGAFIAANAFIAKNAICKNVTINKTANSYQEILNYINKLDKGGQMDEKLKELCAGLVNAFMKAKNEADEEKTKIDDEKKEEKEKEAKNKAKNEDEENKEKEKAANEDTDKRKIIDEIGGILKDKVDEELWRTVIKKAEKLAYDKSEAGTADNKAKNKAKNEDEENKEKEYEELKERVYEEVKNQIAKNSIDNLKSAFYEGKPSKSDPLYISPKKGLELGKQIYG